jgi:2'-5' RNA ligase
MPAPIRTLLPKTPRIRRIRVSKPSTWWPPIATRQDECFRNIWQSLRQHGDVLPGGRHRIAWADRADSYAVCAIRVPASPELAAALEPLREALSRFPFVSLYPSDALHITIQELGLLVDTPSRSDETSLELIDEFARNAAPPVSDFPAFEVTLGGFNSFLDAPFLDVHDGGWCFRIHHRLRDFVLLPMEDAFAFLPHVTLGHYTEQADMGPFPAKMAPWRDRHFGTFVAGTVDVLRMSTSDAFAAPEVIQSFELGHQRGATDAIREGGGPKEFL